MFYIIFICVSEIAHKTTSIANFQNKYFHNLPFILRSSKPFQVLYSVKVFAKSMPNL